ncbi:MAG: FeoB-associated Cys-rich membrane protein [Clostridiaceae bacterium]
MEIFITLAILGLSLYIVVNKIKKASKGDCNCGSCDTSCPVYDDNKNQKIEIMKKN